MYIPSLNICYYNYVGLITLTWCSYGFRHRPTLCLPPTAMDTSYSYGYSYGYPLQLSPLVMRELATCIGHEPTTRYRDYSEAVLPVFSADQERTLHLLSELIRSLPSQLPALSRRLHLLPEFVRTLFPTRVTFLAPCWARCLPFSRVGGVASSVGWS